MFSATLKPTHFSPIFAYTRFKANSTATMRSV